MCDFCNEKIRRNRGFKVDEVTIQYQHGDSYPECSDVTEESVDMCGDCYQKKLEPWLEENMIKGRVIRETDRGY